MGGKEVFIKPGSTWENGCVESVNGKFENKGLNALEFHTLAGAEIIIEQWRRHSTLDC